MRKTIRLGRWASENSVPSGYIVKVLKLVKPRYNWSASTILILEKDNQIFFQTVLSKAQEQWAWDNLTN